MTQLPSIAVFGGAHFDHVGTLATPYQLGQSHPGHWNSHVGGVACNIARHLTRFGHDVPFATCLGNDSAAERLLQALSRSGLRVNAPFIFEGSSPSYTVMHDQNGHVLVGLADMTAYGNMHADWADATATSAEQAQIWLLDSNLQDAAVQALCARKAHRPLVATPVSPAKTDVLKPYLAMLDGLICNLDEAAALLGMHMENSTIAAQRLHDLGPQYVAVTDGAKSTSLVLNGGPVARITPVPLASELHLTGAGDAFAAALCSGLARGVGDAHTLLQYGINAAQLTAQASETCPHLNWADIDAGSLAQDSHAP